MAWLIYIYRIKVHGSRFPEQVSVFQSGDVSVKYGPPLCWGTLRILSKMLNSRHAQRLFIGFLRHLERLYGEGSVNEAKIKIQGRKY